MKIKTKITALLASLTFLASCKESEEYGYHHTVGEENNAITLMAGISEGGAKLQTRSAGSTNVDQTDNHAKHLAFTSNTKAAIRIDGTWKGKADGTYTKGSIIKGSIASEVVTQTTTATIKNETSNGSKHNAIEFTSAEQLYWDDYGTAAPENMGTGNGRDIGLSIYGAAVDGVTTAPDIDGTTGKKWNELTWTLDADQKTNDWKNKDLLISNNINTSGPDGTYRFDDRDAGKLLEFKHAMSKITIRLIANEGFPATGVGETTNKFASSPEVKLTGDEGDASTNAYANTVCTVNVTDGTCSNSNTPAVITMRQGAVQESQKTTYTAIYEALVAPGSLFGAPQTTDSKEVYPIIARINADGNIYYVTSEKIRAKMKELNASTDYQTESGKNYIINVTVNKTEIKVTATVTNWIDVNAEPVTPTINITADWGNTTGASTVEAFSFYRSLALNNGYSSGLSTNVNGYFAAEAIAKKPNTDDAQWVFNDGTQDIKLFWPTHDTHYQFRGVWPKTSTETSNTETEPHVKALSASDDTQIINISNVAYSANSYPSDLMIARPEFGLDSDGKENDPECTNSDHTHKKLYSEGICATEGKVIMNFQYVMSQVEVELQTVSGDAAVNIGANTKVEIVNVANDGYVKLGDRIVVPNTQNQTYVLNPANTGSLTGDALTKAQRTRHSAIVPQTLTYTNPGESTNVRFKVTIYKGDSTTDVDDIYYADINPILNSAKTGLVAPNGKWESGVHYKYTLTLSKTEIKVTATLTDWVTVQANQPVWF